MKKRQVDGILRWLQKYGTITPLEAQQEFSCMRLGARIWDLRNMGYDIKTEREKGKNKFGETVYYAKYRLVS